MSGYGVRVMCAVFGTSSAQVCRLCAIWPHFGPLVLIAIELVPLFADSEVRLSVSTKVGEPSSCTETTGARLITRYGRFDLLCLDELGYVQLDTRGSELLFQILTEREEKSSIALASNLPFSEWGQVIGDARLVAAIVDRVTFNAHIIETGTDSYRLRTTRQRRTGGAKSNEQAGANPA